MSAPAPLPPATIKSLVCLANSRKHQGRCVAGRELIGQTLSGWIRPVSDRMGEEVSERERQYQGAIEPRPLDIVDIPMLGPKASSHQQENWLLAKGWFWAKRGRFPFSGLAQAAEAAGSLWLNNSESSTGINNRVPIECVSGINCSLKLIAVQDLQIKVFTLWDVRRANAIFSFSGTRYSLRVTDPVIEDQYLTRETGYYNLGAAYLTVSLGENFNGYCYKLVAAIIRGD